MIDAPGSSVVLEGSNFVARGADGKGRRAHRCGPSDHRGPDGPFCAMMNVIGARRDHHPAPRHQQAERAASVPLRVKRVDSLAREAERVRQAATSSYAVLLDQTDSKRVGPSRSMVR